ncbi:hypothetical protein BS17DRAFT_362302, partial [Gyrodon lividus]
CYKGGGNVALFRVCYSLLSYVVAGTKELSTTPLRVWSFGLHMCLGCWHNGLKRPILKHRPRSLTCL